MYSKPLIPEDLVINGRRRAYKAKTKKGRIIEVIWVYHESERLDSYTGYIQDTFEFRTIRDALAFTRTDLAVLNGYDVSGAFVPLHPGCKLSFILSKEAEARRRAMHQDCPFYAPEV